MMTRKHFKALAEGLARAKPVQPVPRSVYVVWLRCVGAVAGECLRDNPKFRVDTFYEACGIGP